MQWAVWIRLSNGTRSRFGVYDSWTHAEAIAWAVGGVVESVYHQPANRRAFFRRG